MKESPLARILNRWIARYYLRKPDQEAILRIKHPRMADLWPALLNEVAFVLRRPQSFRLTGLNVELTNRCNLACEQCPGPGRGHALRPDMTLDTFQSILDRCPTVRTLLPFQWGEPLMSPVLYDALRLASDRGIRTMITTNGTLLDEAMSRRLLEAGLTRLTLSFDGDPELHARLRGVDPDRILANLRAFKDLRDRLGNPCAIDVSMVVDETTESAMGAFETLFADLADRRQYIPKFVETVRTRPCRELWRGVLVVLSNGDVTLCCADATGVLTVGNVARESPAELFNGPALARVRSEHRRRAFSSLCRTCGEYVCPKVSPRFS